MLKRWLTEITSIDEVEGVYVASNRADIVNRVGLKHSDEELRELTIRILRIIAVSPKTRLQSQFQQKDTLGRLSASKIAIQKRKRWLP